MAAALTEGEPAPAFKLPRDDGSTVSLKDFRGRKLVIFFYPKADTPACTLESIEFSKLRKDFEAVDTAVLGVSADPVKKQARFRDKYDLGVPLLSDETHEMLEAYRVWQEKTMFANVFMGIVRTTFLIGRSGRIARIWTKVKAEGHASEVLEAAKALA